VGGVGERAPAPDLWRVGRSTGSGGGCRVFKGWRGQLYIIIIISVYHLADPDGKRRPGVTGGTSPGVAGVRIRADTPGARVQAPRRGPHPGGGI
jgi:hypothetical protein